MPGLIVWTISTGFPTNSRNASVNEGGMRHRYLIENNPALLREDCVPKRRDALAEMDELREGPRPSAQGTSGKGQAVFDLRESYEREGRRSESGPSRRFLKRRGGQASGRHSRRSKREASCARPLGRPMLRSTLTPSVRSRLVIPRREASECSATWTKITHRAPRSPRRKEALKAWSRLADAKAREFEPARAWLTRAGEGIFNSGIQTAWLISNAARRTADRVVPQSANRAWPTRG